MMKRERAAAYLDLTPARMERAMAEGLIPYPVSVAGVDLWSRAQLDEYIERLTGERVDDWRGNAPVYQGVRR